jgi:hypothetical protein
MRRSAFAVITALLGLGCSPDLRDVLEPYRGSLLPTLERLPAIHQAVKAAPRPQRDELRIEDSIPIESGPTAELSLTYLEDLEDPKELGHVSSRMPVSADLNRCAALFETHREVFDPELHMPFVEPRAVNGHDAKPILERCASIRYLYVLRTQRFAPITAIGTHAGPCPTFPAPSASATAPSAPPAASSAATPPTVPASSASAAATGAPPAASSAATPPTAPASSASAAAPSASTAPLTPTQGRCKTFRGGFLDGDVFVFDLRDGSQVGAFRVTAEANASMEVPRDASEATVSRLIHIDFGLSIQKAILSRARFLATYKTGRTYP